MGRLLLVRHGQASADAEDYDVLSEVGWQQGRLVGPALRARGVEDPWVVRGGLRRHRETAEALCDAAGWDAGAAEVDAGWDEFDHLDVLAPFADDPGALDDGVRDPIEIATARWTGGEHDGDYAEPWPAFRDRCEAALRRTAEAAGRRTTVVVSSGGVISAVAAALLGVGAGSGAEAGGAVVTRRLNGVLANSSVTTLVVGRRGTTLLSVNEHAHLPRELVTYR